MIILDKNKKGRLIFMKNEMINKIDLLIEMSGAKGSYESLTDELSTVSEEIERQKEIVRDLKKSISDNSYVNSNERLIDENIKIGLENRIKNLRNSLKDAKKQIEETSIEEETLHNLVASLTSELEGLHNLLDSLELKMKTVGSKSEESYSFYEKMIEKTTHDIEQTEKTLEEKRKKYQQITKKLERLGTARKEIENKLNKEEERLEEINTSLLNSNSYIDQKKKTQDEKNIDRLMEALEELERHRLEILTNPIYIGHEATELVLAKDETSALEKIKELVTIVNTLPYMETPNQDLEELLENATTKRDEFANSIEEKKYNERDYKVRDLRIEYLQEKSAQIDRAIEYNRSLIKELDNKIVVNLASAVDTARKEKNELEKDIEEYRKVISASRDYLIPRKSTMLHSALRQKEEELAYLTELLKEFESDLENTIIHSKNIEEKEILALEKEKESIQEEITKLKKRIVPNEDAKDLLAMQRDKETLKELNDEVEKLTHRKKYTATPSEIYDEIELAFRSGITKETKKEETKQTDFINLNDYRINPVTEPQEELKEPPKEEEKEVPEPVEIETPNDMFIFPEEEVVPTFPPRTTKETTEPELLKVVNIEPLDDTTSKKEETKKVEALPEDDFMINDFNDTDYISFNDLLEGTTK